MDDRIYKGKPEYLYHTLEEFNVDHPNIEPVYWRDGKKDDWVYTDEGGIVRMLNR